MTPKQFLLIGGIVLLLLGILGFIGFRLGDALYFDNGENYAHTVLGIVAIIASYALSESAQRSLVWLVFIIALFFGIWGFVVAGRPAPNFYGLANLEFLDNIVHLAVALWAFMAARAQSTAAAR